MQLFLIKKLFPYTLLLCFSINLTKFKSIAFSLFFKREETEGIRKKVQKRPFTKVMEALREYAKNSENIEPENHTKYVIPV